MRLPFMRKPQTEVVMYATRFCGYCVRARRLLEQKKVQYQEIRVDNDPGLWREMEEKSGGRTVPQIFIDGVAIGGCTELYALDAAGELDKLLNPAAGGHGGQTAGD